jgi:hypothetical protein
MTFDNDRWQRRDDASHHRIHRYWSPIKAHQATMMASTRYTEREEATIVKYPRKKVTVIICVGGSSHNFWRDAVTTWGKKITAKVTMARMMWFSRGTSSSLAGLAENVVTAAIDSLFVAALSRTCPFGENGVNEHADVNLQCRRIFPETRRLVSCLTRWHCRFHSAYTLFHSFQKKIKVRKCPFASWWVCIVSFDPFSTDVCLLDFTPRFAGRFLYWWNIWFFSRKMKMNLIANLYRLWIVQETCCFRLLLDSRALSFLLAILRLLIIFPGKWLFLNMSTLRMQVDSFHKRWWSRPLGIFIAFGSFQETCRFVSCWADRPDCDVVSFWMSFSLKKIFDSCSIDAWWE